jgi:murein DD-endopeptidase MepM/ murein hydrolase activator NlpD
MSERNSARRKKENKNVRALFSVLCLCIIGLGMIVYFGTNSKKQNPVNENTTLIVTTQTATEVQRAVTVPETTASPTTEKKKKQETKPTEPPTMEQNAGNTPYKGDYVYPLSEAVLKGYTEELVYNKTMGDYRAHAAVDFKGSLADDVLAINDGIVLKAYTDSMLGNVIEIDHGGKLTVRYCGLESMSVKAGSRVSKGSKIGTLGKIPSEGEDDIHLHLEARLDGKSVNILDVMGKTE